MRQANHDFVSILAERARALAVRDEAQAQATEALAAFTIGGHLIGVPLPRVTRAAALRHMTEVPGAPEWVVGLIAVDGHLMSLVHLALFLGLAHHGIRDISVVLVVGSDGRELGLAAEQLLGIEDVAPTQMVAIPGANGPLRRLVRRGHGANPQELLVLDVAALFEDPRLGRERG